MKKLLHFLRSRAILPSAPQLSIIVVVYNMRREAMRTLRSLSEEYQRNSSLLSYEVIVVENGSSAPLGSEYVTSFGSQFSYYFIDDAPVSPAFAINYGVSKARGNLLGIMIDGAHILTPGVLHHAMNAFKIFPNPIIATRYWFLGPGQQWHTVQNGYSKDEEDKLLLSIDWPENGYRLFEIGVFIFEDKTNWLQKPFESNCLFLRKESFYAIGGFDERFDLPGGGFANLDFYKRAVEMQGSVMVSILGEATFHQLHGGTTTNIDSNKQEKLVQTYRKQYRDLCGCEYHQPLKPMHVVGHIHPYIHKSRFKKS